MKKVLAMLLALVMAVSLVACGGDSSGKESNSASGNAGTNDSTSGNSAGGDKVEVVFWYSLSGSLGDELVAIIDEYNNGRGAEKGIYVNAVYQGYDGTNKQILAAQTNDTANAADINQGLTSTIPSVMELGWTIKAAELYEKFDSDVPADSFPEAMRASVSFQDEMICLPFMNSTLVMCYNNTLLKEAGYDRPPETLDELVEYTTALTKRDANGNISRYGFESEIKRYQMCNFIIRQSPEAYFYDMEGGRAGIATKVVAGEEGTLAAFLEKLGKLVETGGYAYVESNQIADEFINQTSAIILASCNKNMTFKDMVTDFEWYCAPIPLVNEGDTGSSGLGGSCLELYDRGDEARLEAAWDFAQYLCSPECSYRFATHSGYVPINKSVAELPEMQAFWEENPQFKVAFDILMNAPKNAQEPMEPVYNEADGVISDNIRAFCDGKMTVDETVNAIVTQVNRLLDDWHEANT